MTVILGHRGSGKSTLAKVIQECYPRKIIFDTMHEYGPDRGLICETFEEFSEAIVSIKQTSPQKFCLIIRLDIERENRTQEFNECLRILFKYLTGILIVVEEVHTFSSTHFMPHWLLNELTLGRHPQHALIFTSQRPGLCHKLLISQAHHLFCGRIFEKNDVEYVRTMLGDDAYRLATLPNQYFLYWQAGEPIRKVHNSLGESCAVVLD